MDAFGDFLGDVGPTQEMGVQKKFWINIGLIILFGVIYAFYLIKAENAWATPLGDGEKFSFGDKLINGFYASIIIHTSVGFGDFYPKHLIPKVLVMIHSVLVFFINLVM